MSGGEVLAVGQLFSDAKVSKFDEELGTAIRMVFFDRSGKEYVLRFDVAMEDVVAV